MNELSIVHESTPFDFLELSQIRRVIDIGCHRGEQIKHILRPNLPAAEILGVEPKHSNYGECLRLNLPGVSFIQHDCRDLSVELVGQFDLVWCCGLIYHLDDPTQLLRAIRAISHEKSYVCIEGHVASEAEQAHLPRPNPPIVEKMLDGRSYRGKLFREFPAGLGSEEKDACDEQSLDNEWSFWLTADSMVNMFHHYGFGRVIELRSCRPDVPWGPGRVYAPVDPVREWSVHFYILARDRVVLARDSRESRVVKQDSRVSTPSTINI